MMKSRNRNLETVSGQLEDTKNLKEFQLITGQSPTYHDDRQRVNTLIIMCWFTAGKSATPVPREEVEGRGRKHGAVEKRFCGGGFK
jgi:hypothetical protein